MAGILRGEIRWADLDPTRGHEQAGRRPVLILSHDVFNARSGTVIAVALTSQPQKAGFPLTLEIKATGLPMSADGQPPTAFVHFQLLGHPDQFTNPVPSSNSPEFKEKFTFPIITSDQQLRLLHRSRLHISVVDLKGEELDQDNEGLIGEVEVLSFNFL